MMPRFWRACQTEYCNPSAPKYIWYPTGSPSWQCINSNEDKAQFRRPSPVISIILSPLSAARPSVLSINPIRGASVAAMVSGEFPGQIPASPGRGRVLPFVENQRTPPVSWRDPAAKRDSSLSAGVGSVWASRPKVSQHRLKFRNAPDDLTRMWFPESAIGFGAIRLKS